MTATLRAIEPPPQPAGPLMTLKEVAAILGVTEAWVRNHCTRRRPFIKHVKLGRYVRFRRRDVEEFIERCNRIIEEHES